jgi:hypothetical protein
VRPRTVHFYIYYRIAATHAATARSAIETVMQTLSRQFGVNGRLLRAQNDPALWMEIYENVADPERFEAELSVALARSRFASWLSPGSTRRIERFVDLEKADESGERTVPRA